MRQLLLKTLATVLFFMQFYSVSAQYQSVTVISKTFVQNNKKILQDFLKNNDKKVKILVLPFLNQQQKPDEYSDNIAREIASQLQLEFQGKNNIMIFVKDEFDGKNSSTLSGYSTADNNNKYYENLLEKFRPNFFIEGNYALSINGIQQDILSIQSVNIKNYYFKTSEGIQKTELSGNSTIIPSQDKTMDIKTKHFIWASGKGAYYEKAEGNSLENLISKIAASLQTKFMAVKPTDKSIGEFSKEIIKSYQYSLADKIKSKVVSEEDGNCEIIKYISKDILKQIFDEKEITVKNYLKLGQNAENELRIADALSNYYRALVLLFTHPDYSKLNYDFGKGEQKMSAGIPEKIRTVLRNIKFNIASAEEVSQNNKTYTLDITYNNKAVQNVVYQYWTGNSYSPHVHATNGTGIIDLYGASATNTEQIKCKIEYMFAYKSSEDLAFSEALNTLAPPRFSEAKRKIVTSAVKKNIEPTKLPDYSKTKNINTSITAKESKTYSKSINTNNTNNSTKVEPKVFDAESAAAIVQQVSKAIKTKQYSSVRNLFDNQGYDMYTKLIKYGNAKVLNTNGDYKFVSMNKRNVFRSVPMQFTFGNKIFIENVNYTFNTDNKISSVAFALTDKAINDIMATSWSNFDKYELLSFMENYKTAYQLKRLDYINSIFSENALIIIGHVLKNSPEDSRLTNVRYDKLSKKEYIKRLGRSFAANSHINLRFEESNVKQGKLEHVYGIQLNQIYSSSNYSDNGYLFLLIDLRKPEEPLIHVRTWQPHKSPDGSIFGVEDFYFD